MSYRRQLLSRLGDVAVLSNAQKPTQRVEENEEIEECVEKKNKKKLHTHTLMKKR